MVLYCTRLYYLTLYHITYLEGRPGVPRSRDPPKFRSAQVRWGRRTTGSLSQRLPKIVPFSKQHLHCIISLHKQIRTPHITYVSVTLSAAGLCHQCASASAICFLLRFLLFFSFSFFYFKQDILFIIARCKQEVQIHTRPDCDSCSGCIVQTSAARK